MATRKTIEVDKIRETANRHLAIANSTSRVADPVSQRWGIIGLVETVLHATGNYRGFSYLPTEWDAERQALREGYDETRRRYH